MHPSSLRLSFSLLAFSLLAFSPAAVAQTPRDAGAVAVDVPVTDASVIYAPAPDAAVAAPAAEVTTSSEEVPGIAARRGRAETIIDAPFEVVARAVLDYAHYNTFMPHVTEARVVHRNRADTDVYMQVPLRGALGVMWALVRVHAQRTPNRLELAGHAIDGNMERFESNTLIERLPGPGHRTRLVFTLLALPRLPFPASVFTRENVNASRTVAGNLRGQIIRSLADAGTPR